MRKLLLCLCLCSVAIATSCAPKTAPSFIWYISRMLGGDEIVALNPVDGNKRIVTKLVDGDIHRAGLSPNGKMIAFDAVDPSKGQFIGVVNIDGSSRVQVPYSDIVKGYVWLDDNRLLICGATDDSTLWTLLDVTAAQMRPLTPIAPIYHPYILHHSNKQALAVGLGSVQTIITGYYTVKGDTVLQTIEQKQDPRNLPKNLGAQVSQDQRGASIAFIAEGGPNNSEIFLLADQGRTLHQLTNFQENYGVSSVTKLSLSPDGKWVIFNVILGLPKSTDLPIDSQLALVSTENKTLGFLRKTDESVDGVLAWSPDNRYVAVSFSLFAGNVGAPVRVIDIESGEIRTYDPDFGNTQVFDWR